MSVLTQSVIAQDNLFCRHTLGTFEKFNMGVRHCRDIDIYKTGLMLLLTPLMEKTSSSSAENDCWKRMQMVSFRVCLGGFSKAKFFIKNIYLRLIFQTYLYYIHEALMQGIGCPCRNLQEMFSPLPVNSGWIYQ